MYKGGLHVLSFQIKKRIPIGRGGMILTDSIRAYNWLKKASYDGRNLKKDYMKDKITFLGYHFYMTPEDAARGLLLMDMQPKTNEDSGNFNNYYDLSKIKLFNWFNMTKTALITGISGQDGSFLAEHLLSLNYNVHGLIRRLSVSENQDSRISGLDLNLHYGDLLDEHSLYNIINKVKPDEVYNLGAMSHVRT